MTCPQEQVGHILCFADIVPHSMWMAELERHSKHIFIRKKWLYWTLIQELVDVPTVHDNGVVDRFPMSFLQAPTTRARDPRSGKTKGDSR